MVASLIFPTVGVSNGVEGDTLARQKIWLNLRIKRLWSVLIERKLTLTKHIKNNNFSQQFLTDLGNEWHSQSSEFYRIILLRVTEMQRLLLF